MRHVNTFKTVDITSAISSPQRRLEYAPHLGFPASLAKVMILQEGMRMSLQIDSFNFNVDGSIWPATLLDQRIVTSQRPLRHVIIGVNMKR